MLKDRLRSEPQSMADTPPQPETAQPEGPPSEQSGATPVSAEDKALERLLAEAQARIEEQRDAWMRALAETENVRKRAQADIAAAHKFAVERFVESLLPVCDSLEAALDSGDASLESLRSGVELTLKQLRAALEKARVSEIVPVVGERFDPHRHQAISMVEADAEPNSVIAVMQKGYRLHERVIRPALVAVTKPAMEPKAAANDSAPS
jgi:molecular chaperone GrpE